MDAQQAKELTKALTGKELPARREKLAIAAYNNIQASGAYAIEKAAITCSAAITIRELVALAAQYLANGGAADSYTEEAIKGIVKAAAFIAEATEQHINAAKGQALRECMPDLYRE